MANDENFSVVYHAKIKRSVFQLRPANNNQTGSYSTKDNFQKIKHINLIMQALKFVSQLIVNVRACLQQLPTTTFAFVCPDVWMLVYSSIPQFSTNFDISNLCVHISLENRGKFGGVIYRQILVNTNFGTYFLTRISNINKIGLEVVMNVNGKTINSRLNYT